MAKDIKLSFEVVLLIRHSSGYAIKDECFWVCVCVIFNVHHIIIGVLRSSQHSKSMYRKLELFLILIAIQLSNHCVSSSQEQPIFHSVAACYCMGLGVITNFVTCKGGVFYNCA